MSRKKTIWLVILVVAASGIWYGYREFTRTHADLTKLKADIKISADDLIKEFETGDSASVNKKYYEKIIEVTGDTREINKNQYGDYTIILGQDNTAAVVQCEMDTVHQEEITQLTKDSPVVLKGHFVGFQKSEIILEVPLGATISLNRCVIVKKE